MPDIHKFDGYSRDIPRLIAQGVIDAAIEDLRDATGEAELDPLLACFLECRIAMAVRGYEDALGCF